MESSAETGFIADRMPRAWAQLPGMFLCWALRLQGALPPPAQSYRPVIMLHGVGSTHTEMATIKALAERLRPTPRAISLC